MILSQSKIGVLALQGDFKEHKQILSKLGVQPKEVRLPSDLNGLSGLIIPGGESTTISKLMKLYGLDKAIKAHYKKGLAIYGTCAGAIVIAKKVIGETRFKPLGIADIEIERNAYGSQADSFETELEVNGIGTVQASFIRAPILKKVGKNFEVLAKYNGKAVLAKQGNILVGTFHPEISGEMKVHAYFARMCKL